MALGEFFTRIADGAKPKGLVETAAQGVAGVIAPLYGFGAVVNRLLHEAGAVQREELKAPVLSVGNITVGGTGKTPFCLWLVEFLQREGRRPAILTRGYGRADEAKLTIVHDGKRLLANTRDAGDEPVLLARALQSVPVVACASRAEGGRHALQRFEVDTLVLDDGFQHHALSRNGDIVLVDCTRPLSSLSLFPRGTLRETTSALQRAHLIVLTRWQQARDSKRVWREVRAIAPSVPIARTRIAITSASRVADRSAVPMESLAGKKAILLCAVGNPDSVKRSVRDLGVRLVGMKRLPDHAPITKELLLRYDSARKHAGADFLLVTEKDAVKLVELGSLPAELIALRARIQMLEPKDEATAERIIRARLQAGPIRGFLR
jgi:tetraacyldisaccharide 4'-kinase